MIPTREPAHDSTPPAAPQQPTAAATHLPPPRPGRPSPVGAGAAGSRAEPALQAALVRLDGQLTRVDGKASALLTLATALAGGALTVVAVLAAVLAAGHAVPAAAAVLAWAAAAALTAAVGTLLLVVRPAVASGAGFPAWAGLSLEQLLDHLTAGDTGNPATEVLFLSRLAVTKYRLVRRAVDLMTAGLALAAAGAVTAAVLR